VEVARGWLQCGKSASTAAEALVAELHRLRLRDAIDDVFEQVLTVRLDLLYAVLRMIVESFGGAVRLDQVEIGWRACYDGLQTGAAMC